MKYILEIPDNKKTFAEEFFKSVSFIKNIKTVADNEITNIAILTSIEQYENSKIQPTVLNLEDLKKLMNA